MMEKPEEIKRLVAIYHQELIDAESTYRQKVEDINYKFGQLRKACAHEEQQYCPDPSGNNDSCYVCLVCGKEGKKL